MPSMGLVDLELVDVELGWSRSRSNEAVQEGVSVFSRYAEVCVIKWGQVHVLLASTILYTSTKERCPLICIGI